MKAVYRAALMLVALVFLLPFSARAEIKEGSVELGLFGGLHLFESSQNLKDRAVFGGRIGYNFTNHFGIEGSEEFVKTRVDDQTITVANAGQFISPMDRVRVRYYHLDAVYHFSPDGKFNPFVVAGTGAAHYSPTISNKDMSTVNFGIGAKYWVADNVALRADLRDNIVLKKSFHNIEATLGISVALGGKAKSVPAPAKKVDAKPQPKAEKPVVIIVSEPEVEKKVAAVVAEPEIEKKVIVLALEDIHFEFDSSALTQEAQAILKRNIQILHDTPKAQVRIAGYASASGTDEYNQKLSERRANAIKDYLVKEGLIIPSSMITIGYGETNPETYEVAPKDLYSPAAKSNMRVLFEIVVK